MTEKEIAVLEEAAQLILLRHVGDDKKAVAAMMIDVIVKAFEDTEGRIIQ